MTSRVYCSFCGRSDIEADVLVAGPAHVFICSICVDDALEVVARKRADLKLLRDIELCAACRPAPFQQDRLR